LTHKILGCGILMMVWKGFVDNEGSESSRNMLRELLICCDHHLEFENALTWMVCRLE
jgi:ammonia channel protein AmtB